MPSSAFNYAITPDSRTIVFVTTEVASTRNTPVIYSIQEDGRRLTRISAGQGGGDDDGEGRGRGGFGGFGGGIGDLNIARDGRTLFFREGQSVYSVSLSPAGGGAGGGGGFAGAGGGSAAGGQGGGQGGRRRVNFVAKVRIDKPAEWAEMFDDAWRTMKYRFYDPEMQRDGAISTGHLGLELESDEQAGRYRVTHVYEDGPADKDWVKVGVGDYLLAINGKPVKAGDNYWPLLNNNNRLNRKLEVTFNSKPTEEGAWKTRIEPISTQAYSRPCANSRKKSARTATKRRSSSTSDGTAAAT